MSALERARHLVGVRYRPGGRHPDSGLDCLGVVLSAFRMDLCAYRGRDGRSIDEDCAERLLRQAFEPVEAACDGDLVVMRQGRRWHLGIADGDALIHADARAGRVVRRRGHAPWPVVSRWREKD